MEPLNTLRFGGDEVHPNHPSSDVRWARIPRVLGIEVPGLSPSNLGPFWTSADSEWKIGTLLICWVMLKRHPPGERKKNKQTNCVPAKRVAQCELRCESWKCWNVRATWSARNLGICFRLVILKHSWQFCEFVTFLGWLSDPLKG